MAAFAHATCKVCGGGLLNLNGIVAEDAAMNTQTLPNVWMPAREGFVTT